MYGRTCAGVVRQGPPRRARRTDRRGRRTSDSWDDDGAETGVETYDILYSINGGAYDGNYVTDCDDVLEADASCTFNIPAEMIFI